MMEKSVVKGPHWTYILFVGVFTGLFMGMLMIVLGPWMTQDWLHSALCSGGSGAAASFAARPIAGLLRRTQV
jgi:hypothetical protein